MQKFLSKEMKNQYVAKEWRAKMNGEQKWMVMYCISRTSSNLGLDNCWTRGMKFKSTSVDDGKGNAIANVEMSSNRLFL